MADSIFQVPDEAVLTMVGAVAWWAVQRIFSRLDKVLQVTTTLQVTVSGPGGLSQRLERVEKSLRSLRHRSNNNAQILQAQLDLAQLEIGRLLAHAGLSPLTTKPSLSLHGDVPEEGGTSE
jgi:hypothetical protein